MSVHELLVVDHHFEDAGGKYLHKVDILTGLGAVGAAEYAVVDEIVQKRHYLINRFADLLCKITCGAFLAQACGNGDISFIVAYDVRHRVILGCVFVDLVDNAGYTADYLCKLDDLGP